MKRALVCVLTMMAGITNLVAQTSGDYRSNPATGSGLWNATASWETFDGANWVAAASTPTATTSGTITIRSGHTITVSATVSVDQVVIDAGGTLVTNSGTTLTLANGAGNEITVNGTLTNHGTIAFGSVPNRVVAVTGVVNNDGTMTSVSVLKLLFQSGSSYNHQFANGGVIPLATWDVNSTANIVGYTSGNFDAPGGMNQQFGNFVWNAPGQDATVTLSTGPNGAPTTINGDFRVVSTGTDALIYSSGGSGGTLNISKNLTVSGGTFAFTTGDTGPSALDIAGGITISGDGFIQFADDQDVTLDVAGNFLLQDAATVEFSASTGTTTFNLQGNYTQTGGSIFASGNVSNINFSGTTTQTYASALVPNGALNYTVVSGSTLAIPNNSFLSGSGTLTVEGTLQLGSTHASGAIQTGTSNGNIRVSGARTYASGSTIVYNGAAAQFLGAGHPSAAGVITQINNTSGVSLAANVALNGTLELVSGNLSVGARTLTLGGSIIPNANSIVVATASNLTINGSGDLTLPLTGSTTINNFTLNRGSGTLNTVFLSNHFTIAGTFTQSNGNLDFRGWILTVSGNYSRTGGTLSVNEFTGVLINGTGTLGTVAFSSPAPAAQPTLNTLRLERPAATMTISGNLYLTSNLLLVSGALTPGGLQLATGSTITRYDGGSMTASPAAETSYNLIYQTSTDFNTGPELPASTTALANLTNLGTAIVTLDKNATVNGVLTLSNGTLNGSTRTLTLRGNFVSNSIGNFVSGPVVFDGITTISGATTATFGAVTVNSGATLNLGPATAPATTVSFAGDINNTGTINGGLSTAVFAGNTTLKNGTGGKTLGDFNNVQITGTLALQTVTVAPNPDVDIEKITVSGNWISSGGTFTANFSRVDLTGSSQTLITNGSAFYSLYLEGSGTVLLHEPLIVNNDLVVDNNVTLDVDINNNYTVTIKDDFTVNGTFQGRFGKVIFTNGESQSILRTSGSGTLTLFDLEVNKNSNATVDLQTNVLIQNSLVIKTATVFAANSSFLTLGSTAARTAYVGQLPTGASVTGTVIVQRYMPNATGQLAWRYLASPVTNSFVSDWKAENPITGTFSDPSTGPGISSKTPSMYYYDETYIAGGTTLEARYRNYPASGLSTAAPLKNGLGYSMWIRSTAPTMDTRGTIGQGNVPVQLTARSAGGNDGWNLVGNPYPSAIDWDNVTKPAGLNNAIYFTDNVDNGGTGAGNTISYVDGVGTGSYSGLIAQGQAFFVRATANTTLTFKEADKVDGQAQFFRTGEIPNVLRITMEGQGLQDEAVLRLHTEATDAFDERYDAYKWPNASAFNVATVAADNASLSINSVSALDCNKSIQFTVDGAVKGNYVLNFTGMTSFDDNVNLFLLDSEKGTTINLRQTSQYAVTVTDANKANLAKRFSILLGKPDANLALASTGENVCVTSESAQVTLHNSEVGVSYALQRGGETFDFVAGTGGDLLLPIQVSALTEGENEITILAKSSSCAILPLNEKTQVTVVKTLVSTVKEGTSCHEGTVTLGAEAPEATGFHWYENLQSTTAIAGQEGAEFVTPVLTRARTYYVAAVNALGCEGERVAVNANVVIFDDVTLGLEGTTFTSSYATGNQWYLDGTLIEGATGATLTAQASGLYTVEVAVNGCTTSASRSW